MILKPRPFRKPRRGHWATKGLVGCWLMNEGSGNKVFDLSGNGNHGTLKNNAHFVSGSLGAAIAFDGTDDYIEFPVINPDYITVIMSISLGNDPTSNEHRILGENAANMPVFLWWDDGTNKWGLRLRSAQESSQYWGSAPAQDQVVVPAFTYDGITRAHYVDGVFFSSSGTNTGALANESGLPLRLGGEINYTPDLTGRVDYLMIWDWALSASEIALLYREPFCMFERESIELWSAATLGEAPPVGMAGAMTTNTGYWGW